jgi:hypothetical protein
MRALLACTLLLLSACSVPMGGVGETARGEALSAEATLNANRENVITISSLRGWSCTGTYRADTQRAVRQFPLNCSNGATGMASLAVNAPTADLAFQRASMSFLLNNGESGTVKFGLLS